MLFFLLGLASFLASVVAWKMASRFHKHTLSTLDEIRTEGLAADRKLAELAAFEKKATAVDDAEEPLVRLPNGFVGRASEYETRADGVLVRKDRFKVGFGNVVTILVGSRSEYEIDDIVEKVRIVAQAARADYESGGNGTPGSAPVWHPCPAKCDAGMKNSKEDCEVCDGRGEVALQEPLAPGETHETVPDAPCEIKQ